MSQSRPRYGITIMIRNDFFFHEWRQPPVDVSGCWWPPSDVRDTSSVVCLSVNRCFGFLFTRHPLLRQARHRLITPGCMSLTSWGPVGIFPPDPEPLAAAYWSLWCLFHGLAQGLSVDSQLSEQPDGGCWNKTPAANLHRANHCFPSSLFCLKFHLFL